MGLKLLVPKRRPTVELVSLLPWGFPWLFHRTSYALVVMGYPLPRQCFLMHSRKIAPRINIKDAAAPSISSSDHAPASSDPPKTPSRRSPAPVPITPSSTETILVPSSPDVFSSSPNSSIPQMSFLDPMHYMTFMHHLQGPGMSAYPAQPFQQGLYGMQTFQGAIPFPISQQSPPSGSYPQFLSQRSSPECIPSLFFSFLIAPIIPSSQVPQISQMPPSPSPLKKTSPTIQM
ncbi:hypothetical protein B0H17DRAFT_1155369 [Mycena rosella]|uniref:Uncharacterized protein n=1 Tax=Mycena rosella TaxID=1033263 RepID=A0AAD7F5A7_MYCRO|nr:hypothetical protein B0H17DRAFT_1155369 [Mycena rosella]